MAAIRDVKKPVNVSVRQELIDEARAHKINLSQTLERALQGELKALREARWLAENAEAIAQYNAHIEASGLLTESMRKRVWRALAR